ncbi:Dephospho-CoA kinase [bioreactor metagenome]|uniref:Dephospho-CoA kinase n=1 Tax=bioreactor metagenome TaxID=1076179 RepID=A0A645DQY3_9ZZZZ|nr:dephospho-CoA kinase [Candidatus Pelethousia sp.]
MIRNKTTVIGLTGSMAAGKSTVSHRLAELGAHVIDADLVARQVVLPGTAGLRALVERFGPQILRPDGGLDRPALAALAFGDAKSLAELNAILHPSIRTEMEARLREAKTTGETVAVLDVPLLLESGWQHLCDEVWLVTAPEEIRLARAVARSGISREAAQARMRAQMPEAQKRALADVILENEGSLAELLARVDAQYKRLRKGAP